MISVPDLTRLAFAAGLAPRHMAGLFSSTLSAWGMSELQVIMLACQLQLYPLVWELGKRTTCKDAADLAAFFVASLLHRLSVARYLAENLLQASLDGGGGLFPVKSSLFMANGYTPQKYFRDLDFLVQREQFPRIHGEFEKLSGFLGYINDNDANVTLLGTEDPVDYAKEYEVFGTVLAKAGLHPSISLRLSKQKPSWLHETQFYLPQDMEIVTRTFFNFIFVDEEPPSWNGFSTVEDLYAHQLAQDTAKRIASWQN